MTIVPNGLFSAVMQFAKHAPCLRCLLQSQIQELRQLLQLVVAAVVVVVFAAVAVAAGVVASVTLVDVGAAVVVGHAASDDSAVEVVVEVAVDFGEASLVCAAAMAVRMDSLMVNSVRGSAETAPSCPYENYPQWLLQAYLLKSCI